MSRWEPNARERLEQAALELYFGRGYDETTVGDIAARAGVTPRTYFRYFPDKREVLFNGAEALRDAVAQGVREAPDSLDPLTMVITGMGAAVPMMRGREVLRRREAVIATSTELREREVMKLASISAAVADALARRGFDRVTAQLAADSGLAVFRAAVQLWMQDAAAGFDQILADTARKLTAVVADATSDREPTVTSAVGASSPR